MAKILVVDDELVVCQVLRRVLTGWGHEVEIARSGEEGLERLKDFRPQLLLLDIRMPGVDGLEALPRMKKIDPDVRIIMLTAVSEEGIAKMALREGADDYITKPVNLERLLARIDAQCKDAPHD